MSEIISMIPNREFKLSELSKINTSASEIDNMVTNGATLEDLDALAKIEGLEASASDLNVIKDISLSKNTNLELVKASNLIKYSTNLWDEDKDTQHISISTAGIETFNKDYHSTDFIQVSEGDYSFYGFLTLSYYTAKKVFISRSTINYVGSTIAIPSTVKFIRCSYQYNNSNAPRQINKGSTLLSYEKYNTEYREDLTILNDYISKYKNNVTFENIPNGIYRNANTLADYTSFGSSLHTEVYTMFNTLVDGVYCTKEQLTNNSYGQEIYCYKFTPSLPLIDEGVTQKRFKIFISCGLHGFEKASALATYEMMYDIINNHSTNEYLDFLRHNIDFVVIPCANPSGWDDYTRKTRGGVDLNRNFKKDWFKILSTSDATYPGLTPESEIETQNIIGVLNSDSFDMIIDFHNFHINSNGNYFAYFFSNNIDANHYVAQRLYSQMTREFKKTYSFIPDDYFIGKTEQPKREGMLQNYATQIGVKYSCTFEICNRWVLNGGELSQVYDTDTVKSGTDLLTNYILFMCRYIEKN